MLMEIAYRELSNPNGDTPIIKDMVGVLINHGDSIYEVTKETEEGEPVLRKLR